jgi:hypothetical protein
MSALSPEQKVHRDEVAQAAIAFNDAMLQVVYDANIITAPFQETANQLHALADEFKQRGIDSAIKMLREACCCKTMLDHMVDSLVPPLKTPCDCHQYYGCAVVDRTAKLRRVRDRNEPTPINFCFLFDIAKDDPVMSSVVAAALEWNAEMKGTVSFNPVHHPDGDYINIERASQREEVDNGQTTYVSGSLPTWNQKQNTRRLVIYMSFTMLPHEAQKKLVLHQLGHLAGLTQEPLLRAKYGPILGMKDAGVLLDKVTRFNHLKVLADEVEPSSVMHKNHALHLDEGGPTCSLLPTDRARLAAMCLDPTGTCDKH